MSEFNYTEWMQQNKVGPYRKMNLRESGIGDLPFDFVKAAIESASGDQISGTEEDRNGRSMFRSAKNPNIVYYINNDEQITKHDSETGERYSIGNLRHYDEPTQDYEPDTDADYEEPSDDFDMAEGNEDDDARDARANKMEDDDTEAENSERDLDEKKKGDLSDYIVKNDDGKFYIDQEDPDTGEAIASPGDSFVFTYEGRRYKATVTNKDFGRNGVYLLRLVGEDGDVFEAESSESVTITIPENTDYRELAKAVAKVLIEDYGQHNYKPFLQALIAELK